MAALALVQEEVVDVITAKFAQAGFQTLPNRRFAVGRATCLLLRDRARGHRRWERRGAHGDWLKRRRLPLGLWRDHSHRQIPGSPAAPHLAVERPGDRHHRPQQRGNGTGSQAKLCGDRDLSPPPPRETAHHLFSEAHPIEGSGVEMADALIKSVFEQAQSACRSERRTHDSRRAETES